MHGQYNFFAEGSHFAVCNIIIAAFLGTRDTIPASLLSIAVAQDVLDLIYACCHHGS